MPKIICDNNKTIDPSQKFILVGGIRRRGKLDLVFYKVAENQIQLHDRTVSSSLQIVGLLTAYFLPWKQNDVMNIGLADEANYFFTSNLTGCSIGFGKTDTEVVVVHSNKQIEQNEELCSKHQKQVLSDSDSDSDCRECEEERIKAQGIRNSAEHKMIENKLLERNAKSSIVKTPKELNEGNCTANVFGLREDKKWHYYLQQLTQKGLELKELALY